MAQNIGLKVTLGGVTQVITDITKLEAAIRDARAQLEQTALGSDAFKKLSGEIRVADSQLKNLRKSAEGLEFEAQLGEFAKFGGAITAGFAAATAAVNLFGGDVDRVSKAATQATNLLTIALAARSAAEGIAAARTVALTVATTASRIATLGFTGSLRALYATLVANPFGAVLAVVGLLVTAFFSLTENTESQTIANEQLESSLQRLNSQYEREIGLLQARGETDINVQKIRVKQAQENAQLLDDEFVRLQRINKFAPEVEEARQKAVEARANVEIQQARLTRMEEQKTEDARKKAEDDSKKRADAQKQRIRDLIKLRLDELRVIESLTKQVAQLAVNESEVETQLRKTKQEAEGYANALKSLETFGQEYGSFQADLQGQSDDFYDTFTRLREGAEDYFTLLGSGVVPLEEIQKGFGDLRDTILKQNALFLSPTERQLLTDYAEGYQSLYSVLSEYDTPPFDLKDYETLIVDLALASGKISLDPFERTPEDIAKAKVNIATFFKDVEDDFLANYVKLNLPKITDGVTDPVAIAEATKGLEELGRTVFKNLTDAGQQIVVFEEGTEKVNESVKNLNEDLLLLAKTAKEGFVIQNLDKVIAQYQIPLTDVQANRDKLLDIENQITTKRFDTERKYQDDVLELEKELGEQGIDISEFTYATKLQLLAGFLKKEVDATEEAEEKKRDEFQKTITFIENSIAQFQSVLNSISQLTADYYSIQLEELAMQNEKLLEQVVGDTEEANQKRLEQQEIYEEQRKQIEKKAQKTSLQIQLAQAIANTAQAITRVFAQEGTLGFITSGLVAAANAIQIGLIQQQLSMIDSYRQGGIIKGQGGLVVGPSHEQGGVKFAQGGIELEGGEAVINRMSTIRYNDLLSQINQLGGGKPLMVNNGFDDSRLLEALAKQRSEPIRAYVLEQEITNKQGVTKRLEQLSQI